MSAPDPSRADLYNLLRDRIGPEATEALMTHLPDADEFVTEAMLDATETRLLTRMEEGFGHGNLRFEGVETRLDGVEARLDGVEARLDGVEARLDGVEARLDGVEARLDGVEARLDRIEVQVERLDERLSRLQTTLIGGFAAIVASVIATGALG